MKRSGNDYTVAGLLQGKYNIVQGEVVEIGGNRTSMDEFIRRIEAAKLLPTAAAPAKTPAVPGFAIISGFLGLLAALRMLTK